MFVQCIIGTILAVGSFFIPESPRWLLDTDQDEEGMRVLADLHGEGDPDNEVAKDEFREIKEAVLAEASHSLLAGLYRLAWLILLAITEARGRPELSIDVQALQVPRVHRHECTRLCSVGESITSLC